MACNLLVNSLQIPGGDISGIVEEAGNGSKVSASCVLTGRTCGSICLSSARDHSTQVAVPSAICSGFSDIALQFKRGDRVLGLAPWFWMTYKEGTYAEYVSAKEEWLAYCPKSLPLHEAGQVPLVALTAWQVLRP